MPELDENLKKELKVIADDVNKLITDNKESQDKAIDDKLQTALGKWSEKQKEYETAQGAVNKELQDQADELQTLVKEYKAKVTDTKRQTPYDYFKDKITKNEGFDRYREHKQSFNMQVKADILVSTLFTGAVIEQDRVAETPFALPYEQMRIRSLIPNGSTSSDTVAFVRQTARTESAATVAEAATKPQSDRTIGLITETVQVLAHLFDVSNQALNDYNQMASYLSIQGVAGLKALEDTQILNGDNTGANLNGIITQASTTFAGGTSISSDTHIDTLVRAYWQLRTLNYNVSLMLMPPAIMRDIQLLKDTTNQYIYPGFQPLGLNAWSINGVPLVVHNDVPADTFLVGDGSMCAFWDRESVNVKFSESHSTNFAENMTTIRIEERGCVAVYRTDAFISATFTAAQSTLT